MADCAAIILAAGHASRFRTSGGVEASKVVAQFQGMPLVRHVALAALASKARPVIVVTGHVRAAVEAALAGLAVSCVHNPLFATGMASSLKAGVAAVPHDAAGAVILLGDMPLVAAGAIDRLCDTLSANPAAVAAVPVFGGLRGNPAVVARALFPAIAALSGDQGARQLLAKAGEAVIELPMQDAGIARDIDTQADLAALRAGG